MTINAIEDGTKVTTPTGHVGKVKVTRRERQLISDGKLNIVNVLGTDGLRRKYRLGQLTEIVKEETETPLDGAIRLLRFYYRNTEIPEIENEVKQFLDLYE